MITRPDRLVFSSFAADAAGVVGLEDGAITGVEAAANIKMCLEFDKNVTSYLLGQPRRGISFSQSQHAEKFINTISRMINETFTG